MPDVWDQFPDAPTTPAAAAAVADPWSQFPDAPGVPAAPAIPAGMPAPGTPSSPPSRGIGDRMAGMVMSTLQGGNAGVADLLGAPVDLVNNAPRLANLLPGVSGVGPISDNPIGGSEGIKATGRALRDAAGGHGYEPQNAGERIAERVGREIGSTAVPLAGVLGVGARVGVQGAKEFGPIARMIVEPAAINPAGLAKREMGYATAAGTGAGAANELAGNPQDGHNFWSDLTGSVVGTAGMAATAPFAGVAGKVASTVVGRPVFKPADVVREAVATDVMANSSGAQRQFAQNGMIDTDPIAQALRTPSRAEEVVPGFRADIADRTGDPGLQSYVYNNTAANPGAANARKQANAAAVDERMQGFQPEGSAGGFRESVQAGRDEALSTSQIQVHAAQNRLEEAMQRLHPETTAEGRGATVRGSLNDALTAAREVEGNAWRGIEGQVDMAPLAESFTARAQALTPSEQRQLAQVQGAIGTPGAAEGAVPVSHVTSLRGELTDAIRSARSSGDVNRARLMQGFVDDIDGYMERAVAPELTQRWQAARDESFRLNERFTRPGDPVAEVLRENQGRPRVPDSAVTRQFVQGDNAQATNINRLMQETGNSEQVRSAVRDEILADVRSRGLTERPDQLDRYLQRYSQVFERFPELRDELGTAGTAAREAGRAAETHGALERDLMTPGRSPQASYLKYDDTRTLDAMRTVVNHPRPAEAMRELLDTAGRTPEAIDNARAAFWHVIDREGRMADANAQGVQPWSAKKLVKAINDPKREAVLQELYADRPEVVGEMRQVFEALAGAESGTRLGKAGNTSGTAQAIGQGFDPALSASSIASRMRSVNRGQLSPTIALVDIGASWLRNRSAAIQKGAIQNLKDAVINNPEMAADLLDEYNPATYAAKRAMIFQKYGVRANQVLNVLDEAHDETSDPVKGAVARGR